MIRRLFFLACAALAWLSVTTAAAAAETVSVEEAVRRALRDNPGLKAARYERAALLARAELERPVARPTLRTEATGTLQVPRATFPRGATGDATVIPERYGKVEAALEQTLYRPGLAAARERSTAEANVLAMDVERAEADLVRDVRVACLRLLTAEAMVGVASDGLDLARRHAKLVEDMLEAGLASERDRKAALADVAEAEQGRLQAENGAALARADLARRMGAPSEALISVAEPGPLPPMPDLQTGIAEALQRRVELRSLRERLRSLKAAASLAGLQDDPVLGARATAAAQSPTAFTRSTYFSVGLVLRWDILDGGKARADAAEARARVRQLESLLDEATRGVRLDVEKAWRDLRDAAARLEAATRQAELAQSAHEITELRYEVRQATQMEVSGSLLALQRARANRSQALYDQHIAAAEYARATGAPIPTPAPPVRDR